MFQRPSSAATPNGPGTHAGSLLNIGQVHLTCRQLLLRATLPLLLQLRAPFPCLHKVFDRFVLRAVAAVLQGLVADPVYTANGVLRGAALPGHEREVTDAVRTVSFLFVCCCVFLSCAKFRIMKVRGAPSISTLDNRSSCDFVRGDFELGHISDKQLKARSAEGLTESHSHPCCTYRTTGSVSRTRRSYSRWSSARQWSSGHGASSVRTSEILLWMQT